MSSLKKNLALLGLLSLVAGGSIAETPTIKTEGKTELNTNVKTDRRTRKEIINQHLQFDMHGGLIDPFLGSGRDPKSYGQYLQRIGRQKWNKKQK